MKANVIEIQSLKKNRKGEKGITTVEYALLLVGVAIVVYAGIGPFGVAIKGIFDKVTLLFA